jgi:hypothetical protein
MNLSIIVIDKIKKHPNYRYKRMKLLVVAMNIEVKLVEQTNKINKSTGIVESLIRSGKFQTSVTMKQHI